MSSETKPAVVEKEELALQRIDAEESKPAAIEKPAPNIRFVGKPSEVHGKVIPAEPFTRIESGMDTYLLPEDFELQKAGFFHPKAKQIVRLYPNRYKLIKSKGGK